MPFKSKAQMRAAFGGYLGPEMKEKAKQWAEETPNPKKLPEKLGKKNKFKKHHSCVPQFNGIEKYHDRDVEIR